MKPVCTLFAILMAAPRYMRMQAPVSAGPGKQIPPRSTGHCPLARQKCAAYEA